MKAGSLDVTDLSWLKTLVMLRKLSKAEVIQSELLTVSQSSMLKNGKYNFCRCATIPSIGNQNGHLVS